MISINEAKRLVKRALLANIVCDKPNLAITPLVSGKHGIGKSAMIKSIAEDLGGVCITVEGGTLKEGEIQACPISIKMKMGRPASVSCRTMPWSASKTRKSVFLSWRAARWQKMPLWWATKIAMP